MGLEQSQIADNEVSDPNRANGPAVDALFETLYTELRNLAEAQLSREREGHTLLPTALVHEAYVKLMGSRNLQPAGQTQFRAIAARAMKQVLIDHARHRNREKRGGNWRKIILDDALIVGGTIAAPDFSAVNEALGRLREADAISAELIELRIFGGLSVAEAAQELGLAQRTAERQLAFARAWLRRELVSLEKTP